MSLEFDSNENNGPSIERCPHDRENPYAQISRELLRDQSLSFQLRGFLSYMLSFEKGWRISIPFIMRTQKLCKSTLYRLVDLAMEAGYLQRVIYKEGNLNRTKYYLSEYPKFKKSFRLPKNQDVDEKDVGPYIEEKQLKNISPLYSPQNEPEKSTQSSPEAQELSEKLKTEISYVNPNFNDSTTNWPKIFDQLLKKKSSSHLRSLICWIFKDDFWKSVIVSPSGIKKNIAKLESKMEIEKCNLKPIQKNYSKEAMPFNEEPITSRKPTSARGTKTPEELQSAKALMAKIYKEYGIG